MIQDFKAQIFCRETNLSKWEIDTSDPIWVERINTYHRQRNLLPPEGDPTEYAKAFEALYPQPQHRRQYIDDAISKGTPSFGHKVLGSLIAAGKVDCVFTTNFDPLIEDSTNTANAVLPIDDQNRPTVAAIDSAGRASRCLNESDWPLIAKLHGDYQSIAIKNTGTELENQDTQMRLVLVEAGKRFGMIFVGYSGRDRSIMEALSAILEGPSPFPNGLYWVTSSPLRLLPTVIDFLNRAQGVGVHVALVECATFDELAAAIIKSTNLPRALFDRVMEGRPTPRLVPVPLPTSEARQFPVLRYSSLLIERMPSTARRIQLAQSKSVSEVRKLLKEKNARATVTMFAQQLAGFGKDGDILNALQPLGATLNGEVKLDPVGDSWAKGLLYDALVRSLSRGLPLIPRYRRSGHSVVVAALRDGDSPERNRWYKEKLSELKSAYKSELTGTIPTLGYKYQEGVFLKLDLVAGRWWCGFEPYTFVDIPRPEDPSEGVANNAELTDADAMRMRIDRRGDPTGDWRRERWAQRYNPDWARIIDAWANLLATANGRTKRAFGIDEGVGIDAEFHLHHLTGWSRPGHHHVYFNRDR